MSLEAQATDARVRELLAEYDTPAACAADLLCDRHPAANVAFTIVEADLTSVDLTYGELREQSQRCATVLAERVRRLAGSEESDYLFRY